MPDQIAVAVNGQRVLVDYDTTAAVAIMMAGLPSRRSVASEPRGPLCGMGICFECRAAIDGVPHRRSCQILCAAGMRIETDE